MSRSLSHERFTSLLAGVVGSNRTFFFGASLSHDTVRELDEAAGKKSVLCMTHSAKIQSTEYVAFEGGSGGSKGKSNPLLTLTRALRTKRTKAVPITAETKDGISRTATSQRHSDCFISSASKLRLGAFFSSSEHMVSAES